MPRPTQKCPKCRELRPMTAHHIYPRKWFGRKGNTLTFFLCRRCHDLIHQLIPDRQLKPEQYLKILFKFLEDTKEA